MHELRAEDGVKLAEEQREQGALGGAHCGKRAKGGRRTKCTVKMKGGTVGECVCVCVYVCMCVYVCVRKGFVEGGLRVEGGQLESQGDDRSEKKREKNRGKTLAFSLNEAPGKLSTANKKKRNPSQSEAEAHRDETERLAKLKENESRRRESLASLKGNCTATVKEAAPGLQMMRRFRIAH